MFKKITALVLTLILTIGIVGCKTTVDVFDVENPTISGAHSITYVIDESDIPNFSEGVTVFDNSDGNITSTLVVDSSAVDLSVPGSYTVTYTASDLSENETTLDITVTVVDVTGPTIEGIQGMTFVMGDAAPNYLYGVSAMDNVDGDVTANIVVDSSSVVLTAEGLYEITYIVEDSSMNTSPVYIAYLQVKRFADDADAIPPVITGQSNVTYTIGVSDVPDYLTGVTAEDNLDGDVTASMVMDSSNVDLMVPGIYVVTYTATDATGNIGSADIAVTVLLETEPPVISGIRIIEVYQNGTPDYLLGLSVSDNVSELTVDDIVIDDSAVDLTEYGRYDVTFSVTDEAGNTLVVTTEIIVAMEIITLPVPNATYNMSTSGTDNLNPHSEVDDNAATLYEHVTDSLFKIDFDWDKAIADGLATEKGDFETAGAASIPVDRFPQMAALLPDDILGDGTVWEIRLRTDLEFEDGTAIDASTFGYSWSMLLDPNLVNANADALYDTKNLPLVNAEDYAKQNSFQTDVFGYDVYDVDGVLMTRENSYQGGAIGNPTWDMYLVQTSLSSILVGPTDDPLTDLDESVPYLEDWEDGYLYLEDAEANVFLYDINGNLIAPTAGWFLDGTELPTTGGVGYVSDYVPAYANPDGERIAVDGNGFPVGGVRLMQETVLWSDVGFEIMSTYIFRITLEEPKTQSDVMRVLQSGITGVVHETAYENGMNEDRTATTYGTIDNQLVSYGPYNMIAWETDVLYFYILNQNHYAAADYRITKLRYDIIEDQSYAVDEFKAGRLDVINVGGEYYDEFKYSLNLQLNPTSTFFRFAFNIAGSDTYDVNPILKQLAFRQAFYFAIDRETFSSEIRDPSYPTIGFLGPVYTATRYNVLSYRSSDAGSNILVDLAPETFGYDPVRAKALFDEAYAAAVAAGDIVDGDMVTVEYKYYDVETSWQPQPWFADTIEAIFNAGEATDKFELVLAPVSSAALDDAWDNGDFEMTFGGWQGLDFDAPSMLGQVYNSGNDYMLEVGFDTENIQVTAELAETKAALMAWVADFELEYADFLVLYEPYMMIEEPSAPETTAFEDAVALLDELDVPSDDAIAEFEAWEAVLLNFTGDVLSTTYDGLFHYAYEEFYNENDANYDGRTDNFDVITATLEGVLLDQMIAIPLFSTVSTTVYSTRVRFEINEFNTFIERDDLRYIFIG